MNLLGSLLSVAEICFSPQLLLKASDIAVLFTFQFTQGHRAGAGEVVEEKSSGVLSWLCCMTWALGYLLGFC